MVVSNNYRDRDRAKSCRNQFRAKQKLWKDWCEEKGYPDHDRVSPGKLAVFLEQEVFPKGNRSKGKRNGLALSEQGIEGYIKPIVDLWEVFSFLFPSYFSLSRLKPVSVSSQILNIRETAM